MIVNGVALKKRQKLMRNLRVIQNVTRFQHTVHSVFGLNDDSPTLDLCTDIQFVRV